MKRVIHEKFCHLSPTTTAASAAPAVAYLDNVTDERVSTAATEISAVTPMTTRMIKALAVAYSDAVLAQRVPISTAAATTVAPSTNIDSPGQRVLVAAEEPVKQFTDRFFSSGYSNWFK